LRQLLSKANFKREELWIDRCQRTAQFGEFRGGTVNLQAFQIHDLLPFGEQIADVVQMRQRGLGIHISFAAKSHIIQKSESVIQAAGFRPRPFNKAFAEFFAGVGLPALHFEIRRDGATGVGSGHTFFFCVESIMQRVILKGNPRTEMVRQNLNYPNASRQIARFRFVTILRY
jgi:hypothetical protein